MSRSRLTVEQLGMVVAVLAKYATRGRGDVPEVLSDLIDWYEGDEDELDDELEEDD